MRVSRKVLEIPLSKIDDGIKLCIENALQFCSDAEVLLKTSCGHALGLCILGMEELGKAMMLKEKSAYAQKESKNTVVFEKTKRKCFFKAIDVKSLKKLGFNLNRKVNPFYDHLSKLVFAMTFKKLATHERIMKTLEAVPFSSINEIFEKANKLKRQTQEISLDLREAVFYVDYFPKKGWRKGIAIDPAKVKELIHDIRESIKLFSS